MDLPKRKNIRLPEYDYSAPGAYFVTVCTKDRRCILSNITVGADALGGPNLQLTDTGKIVEKYILSTDRMPGFRVDKYVVMPNHIHMILRIENGPPGARRVSKGTGGAFAAKAGRELVPDLEAAPTNDPQTRAGEPSDRPICAAGPAAPTVSDAVGALKRLVNRALGQNIWQRSYHEHVIRNENDYREIWAYIDANPARWAEDRYFAP